MRIERWNWPGSAYVEVRVVRTGRTMPMLGFGLMEEATATKNLQFIIIVPLTWEFWGLIPICEQIDITGIFKSDSLWYIVNCLISSAIICPSCCSWDLFSTKILQEKDGKTILVRMAIIEGRTSRKLVPCFNNSLDPRGIMISHHRQWSPDDHVPMQRR